MKKNIYQLKIKITFFLIFSVCSLAESRELFGNSTSENTISVRQITGKVCSAEDHSPISGVKIQVLERGTKTAKGAITDKNGNFILRISPSLRSFTLFAQSVGFYESLYEITENSQVDSIVIALKVRSFRSGEVVVRSAKKDNSFGISQIQSVQNAAIYEGKKSELITMEDVTANIATNTARQVFAKVAGLNIWESDQSGLQLGVGGRGLSPNRTAHFNTRQNGYDISADALGYPESYYTPPMEALDKIEVVRGAGSLQYGTQFGGMLNFVMKRGSKDSQFEGSARVSAGSFDFFNISTQVGATYHEINYYIFGQYKKGSGWRPNAGFNATTLFSSISWNPSSEFSASIDITHSNYTAQQPGGLTDKAFEENPRQSFRERNWFSVNWNVAALTFEYSFSQFWKITSRTFGVFSQRQALGNLERITVADFATQYRTLIDGTFQNFGNETRIMHTFSLFNNPSNLLFGARIYSGKTFQIQGDASSNSNPDFSLLHQEPDNSSYTNPSENYALFAEQIIRLSPNLSIIPGVRFEYILTKTDGWFANRVIDFAGNIVSKSITSEQRSSVRSLLLFGLGAAYKLHDNTELYGNISQNYRAINFSDMRLANPNFVIDPNLTDEKGWTADIGFRGSVGNFLYFDVSAYYLRYTNRIGLLLKSDLPPLYLPYRYRTNIGNSRTIGLENVIECDFWKLLSNSSSDVSLTAFVNVSWANGVYTESKEQSVIGKEVELVSPLIIRSGVTYKVENFSVSFQWSRTQKHYTDATNAERTSTAVNGVIPTYSVADCTFRYAVSKKITFEASVNNIFDAMYFTRRAESYPGPGIIPSDGRSMYVGIEVKM